MNAIRNPWKTQGFWHKGAESLCFHWVFKVFWVRVAQNLCFHLVFLTFLTLSCPKAVFSLSFFDFFDFFRPSRLWQALGWPLAQLLPLKSSPDPKKSKKSKNSMKTQAFWDFIVKKVKKVNENIGFWALLIDFHWFCISFQMLFNIYNESVLLLRSFP